jgi:TetR/AcrR family transcriptional regulator
MLRKINKEKKMAQDTAKKAGKRTQAVNEKKEAILAAALETFSLYGIHGTRIEKVAERAGVSKTNLLYYYPSKEALYLAVLRHILAIWLAPLKAFREDLTPLVAIGEYIRLKLEVSRDNPQASRLFCMEMLQGAPVLKEELEGSLKALVEEIGHYCRLGSQRQTGTGRPASSYFYDLGLNPALCRFRHAGRGGDRHNVTG